MQIQPPHETPVPHGPYPSAGGDERRLYVFAAYVAETMNSTITVLPETIILHLFKVEELYFIGYNMSSSARDGTNASVLTYHRIIEAFKFGYAWRSRLGDPDFNMDKNISEVSERYS